MSFTGFSTATSFADGFNVGQNITITLTDANGVLYNLGRVTSFDSQSKQTELESKPINANGYIDYKDMREGWTGTFTMDRTNGALDALEALQEVNFHDVPEMYFTISVVINNDDQSVNEHDYIRCAIKMTNAGSWKLDDKVEQTITFRSAQRKVIQ